MIRFTKEEKTIILFILAILFIGTAVLYYKKQNPYPTENIKFNAKNKVHLEKVNINKAGMLELIKIKGIGPTLAGRIINYREEFGPFGTKEELKNVKGIGDKTYDKIKETIIIE